MPVWLFNPARPQTESRIQTIERLRSEESENDIPDDLESKTRQILKSISFRDNPKTECHIFRLPFNVRIRIYIEIFVHDFSQLEFENPVEMESNQFVILRICRAIYHEAQIAFSRTVSYRTLVFNEYKNSSIRLLRRRPGVLTCCRANLGSFIFPCGLRDCYYMRVILRRVVFEFGSLDSTKAVQRRWAFTHLMMKLRETQPPRIYSLTLAVGKNWRTPGFDATEIAHSIFNGAVEILGSMTLVGLTMRRRNVSAAQ